MASKRSAGQLRITYIFWFNNNYTLVLLFKWLSQFFDDLHKTVYISWLPVAHLRFDHGDAWSFALVYSHVPHQAVGTPATSGLPTIHWCSARKMHQTIWFRQVLKSEAGSKLASFGPGPASGSSGWGGIWDFQGGLHFLLLDWSELPWCRHGQTEYRRTGSKVTLFNL